MVAAAEILGVFAIGGRGVFAGQEHGDHARIAHGPGPMLGLPRAGTQAQRRAYPAVHIGQLKASSSRPAFTSTSIVCRNSSCVAFLPARKCTSSMSRASHSRKDLRKAPSLPKRMAGKNRLVKSSAVTNRTCQSG